MKCAHCLNGVHESWTNMHNFADAEWLFAILWMQCPECSRYMVRMQRSRKSGVVESVRFLYPGVTARPLPTEVPEPYRSDYNEAVAVLTDSPKASAALSRRSLQNVLRERAGVKHGELSKEIDEVLSRGTLPSHLGDAIDAIRNIGNFAAHPIKSQATGAIVEVEPGEAEWLLDVLDGVYDFYFVQPAILKRKRDALDAKLADARKPPAKTSS